MKQIITWDHAEQLPRDELGEALDLLTAGRIQLHEVETGSDQYAIVLADEHLTDEEVAETWHRFYYQDEGGEG